MTAKRILLVEDQPDHAELAVDVLRMAGYEVVHCAQGEEVLGAARRFVPHLILMDINLPGMNGMEVTRLLHGHDETAQIPVLALTAYAMPAEKEKIMAAGCVGVVTKPMDVRKFLATVESLTESSSSTIPAPQAFLHTQNSPEPQ